MPRSQRPDGTVAGSTKRLASRFYQLKMGHARTCEYLHWTKARQTAQCWWCPQPKQTREHLLKGCPRWRKQQKVLWKEVWEETGRGRFWWQAHELFAEPRCSEAVLRFLMATDVGKIVLLAEEREDMEGSEVSECELQERQEQEDKRRAEAEVLGTWGKPLFLPIPPFMALAGE